MSQLKIEQGIVDIIRVCIAVEATRRIPPELQGITFFADTDVWIYHEVSDDRLCDTCRKLAQVGYFMGDHLRIIFPYLFIQDENTIYCMVHPNCRCYLTRLIEIPTKEQYIIWRYASQNIVNEMLREKHKCSHGLRKIG